MTFHLKQAAIAIDQLGNTLAGGWADETWSARCWREDRKGWIRALEILGKDHCFESYIGEQLRLQSPPEERPNVK
jgi:hypothetical protein